MIRALSFAAKAAISAVLLYFAIDWNSTGVLGARLAGARLDWLALMLAVQLVQLAIGAFRWQRIVLTCGKALPLASALRFSFIAAFFNQTLPSSVGGDAARVWLLARRGAGWSAAAYSVVLDRAVGVLMLSIIVIVCLPWTLALITDPVGRTALLIIGFGSFGATVAFIALGHVRIAALQAWAVTRHLLAAAAAGARLTKPAASNALIFALGICAHLLTAMAAWCAAKAVAVSFDFTLALFLVLPVLLVTVVPISIAGWGVRERAMTIAFAYAGLSQSDGLLISLLYGFSMFLVGATGGLVWVFSPKGPSIGALRAGAQAP